MKYRQTVMKAMGAHMSAMSLVVKKKVTRRTQLAAHAEAIRALSGDLPALFPAGTGAAKVKTAALPAVWSQPQNFVAAARTLERESAKLAELARKGDARGFDAQFEKVGAACNACHKAFRQKESE
ncbi:MAG: c-type cytochrome [Thermoanaerobaculia bacterium]